MCAKMMGQLSVFTLNVEALLWYLWIVAKLRAFSPCSKMCFGIRHVGGTCVRSAPITAYRSYWTLRTGRLKKRRNVTVLEPAVNRLFSSDVIHTCP